MSQLRQSAFTTLVRGSSPMRAVPPRWLVSSSCKGNVTTLLERKSRYTVLLANTDRRSSGVIGAVQSVFAELPLAGRQTITFFRGTEFMSYPTIAGALSITSYFCDPHSPWHKGAVENTNGRIRKFLPSNALPDTMTDDALRALTKRLNDTPRRCLDYRTPSEVFRAHLAALPGVGVCSGEDP